MGDIADFLAARIYDDEQAAREIPKAAIDAAAKSIANTAGDGRLPWHNYLVDARLALKAAQQAAEPAEAERLLLECEAKRGILLDYMTRRRQAEQLNRYKTTDAIYYQMPSDLPLKYLALPYRAHPEYSAAWAPPASGTVETWGRR